MIFFKLNKSHFLFFILNAFLLYIFFVAFKYNLWDLFYILLVEFIFLLIFSIFKYKKYKNYLEKIKKYNDSLISFEDFYQSPSDFYVYDYLKRIYRQVAETKRENEVFKKNFKDYINLWTHEIKTPIFALKLLNENNFESKKEIDKLENLVDQVLTYARLEKSDFDYKFNFLNLKDLVLQVIKAKKNLFIEKNLSLGINIPESLEVLSDFRFLKFVLEQIILNSIKYTNLGGIKINFKENFIEIKDTGIGIKKQDLDRITDFGYRGENNPLASSTGLGLYLVKNILDNLGHKFKILSNEDGTNFIIYFETYKNVR